jgi:hypothetical protein
MWALLDVVADAVVSFVLDWWVWLRDPSIKGDRR